MPGIVKKKSKNKWRREKAKEAKAKARESASSTPAPASPPTLASTPTLAASSPPESEQGDGRQEEDFILDAEEPYPEILSINEDDPTYLMYKNVFERFTEPVVDAAAAEEPTKPEVFYDDELDVPDEEDEERQLANEQQKSRKKQKAEMQLSVAELKALVEKPELVEWTDTSSKEPRLLVSLKGSRNMVPIPNHWSMKREYLSSKRGIEKSQFALPKFIQETGISEMRDAVLEKQENATLKQKQRERVQPKMGKLDIDYQRLYEAFFRFQTKPELTRVGEVYYEGKEYETNMRHLRPGFLSEELKEALNMPPGAPPPWLISQQRHGPPPSYPALKIPGLNAPPPPGASWGFHPGGYGKPAVDEFNRPVYGGDVYGTTDQPQQKNQYAEPVEDDFWGELQPLEEESEDEDEEEGEGGEGGEEGSDEGEDEDTESGLRTQTGIESTTGFSSVAPSEYGGTETMQEFTLRKEKAGTETETSTHPRSAGQVIPEQQRQSSGFFGSSRAYNLNAGMPVLGEEDRGTKRKMGDVDTSVDLDALATRGKIGKEELQKSYEKERKAAAGAGWQGGMGDDLSDLIAGEAAKRQKRDQEKRATRK